MGRARSKRDDVSHESPRATAERKWVRTPISVLGPVLNLALGSKTRHTPSGAPSQLGRGLSPPAPPVAPVDPAACAGVRVTARWDQAVLPERPTLSSMVCDLVQ